MSEAETEIRVPDAYDDVDEWAIAAVRGANNWLVTLRNAIDEGIDPWSDEFITKGKDDEDDPDTGIMSYSEGLTAIALSKQFAPIDNDAWRSIRPRYYHEDMDFILNEINSENGPKLKPDPYVGVDTQDFTIAATFSTSAILESINAEAIEFGKTWKSSEKADWTMGDIEIQKEDVKNAIRENLEWLISNKVEEDLESDDAAVGWAWIGSDSDSPQYSYKKHPPTNYFTYSASLVLCDILKYMEDDSIENNDLIRDAVKESDFSEEEIASTIEQAGNFLTNKHWEDECWSMPQGAMESGDRQAAEILSSSYASIGISYIEDALDRRDDLDSEFSLGSSEKEKMGKSLNTILGNYENIKNSWGESIAYRCGGDGSLVDGSTPYVMIDAIIELAYRQPDSLEYVEDFDEDRVKNIASEGLAKKIFEHCWSGDDRYETKGFRHVELANLLQDDDVPDGAPDDNPTAIYTTGIAIETLLLNFLNDGKIIREKMEEKVKETDEETESDESMVETKEVQGKTVNVFLNGEAGDDTDEIDEDIERTIEDIHEEVSGLSDEIREEIQGASGGEGDIKIEELNERSREFMDSLTEYDSILAKEYLQENDWFEDVCNPLPVSNKVSSGLQQNWGEKFMQKNKEMFIGYLSRLYFCPDKETYEKEVKTQKFKDKNKYLLPPQYQAYKQVEGWEDEKFADEETRKSKIEEMVKELKAEPWGGEEIMDVLTNFSKRYKNRD